MLWILNFQRLTEHMYNYSPLRKHHGSIKREEVFDIQQIIKRNTENEKGEEQLKPLMHFKKAEPRENTLMNMWKQRTPVRAFAELLYRQCRQELFFFSIVDKPGKGQR